VRRIKLAMPSAFPYQAEYRAALLRPASKGAQWWLGTSCAVTR
jgi:hypothetical protein